jgi:hypothetical protein
VSTVVGLRDRAIIAVMTNTFARVGAVVRWTMENTYDRRFPESDFRAFGIAASAFFPEVASDEALFDARQKRRYFDSSWQAVRYRYRSCAECQDEFKALLETANEMWRGGTLPTQHSPR